MRPNHGLILFLIMMLVVLAPFAYLKSISQRHSYSPVAIPITLLATTEHKIYQLNLEEYLIGVVAAEMPAEFNIEALKAQAVAARTLAVRRLKRFGGNGSQHYQNVDFSDDPNENQAWLSVNTLITKWGPRKFPTYYQKISQAVAQTAGVIMVYQNRPIDAVFHSTCGVGTESADQVWHYQVPYLQHVKCGFDHQSPRYLNQFTFSWSELVKRFKLSPGCFRSIKIKKRTASGRIIQLSIGGHLISGNDLRQKLDLTSTCFSWWIRPNGLTFTSIGYGHGVGMCQYGADGLAKQGLNYLKILQYYYTGIQFSKIKNF